MVACSLGMTLVVSSLCGCDKERASQIAIALERNPGALAGALIDEPQENYEDYLLQDYDIKSVEQLPMEELEPYDFSGPKVSGIGEMIVDEETDSSEVTQNVVTIYLAPMYNESAIKTYECVSKAAQSSVERELSDNGVVNEKLKTSLSKMYKAYHAKNGDKTYKKIAKKCIDEGWVMQAGIKGETGQLDAHTRLVKALRASLEAKGYNVVVAGSGKTDATSNKERAIAAKDNAASCFICVGTRKSDSKGGWYCLVPTANVTSESVSSNSRNLALSIATEFEKNVTKIPTSQTVAKVTDYDKHTVLNWAEIPTVWIQFGSIKNEDDKRELLVGETIQSFALSVTNAIVKMYPIGGN